MGSLITVVSLEVKGGLPPLFRLARANNKDTIYEMNGITAAQRLFY